MHSGPATLTCQYCGRALKGRIDKKFCDDSCRNAFNNQKKAVNKPNSLVRHINKVLFRNRLILETLLPDSSGMKRAHRDHLSRLGFEFNYITHTFTNQKGKTYYFCYEYGYLLMDSHYCLVVRSRE